LLQSRKEADELSKQYSLQAGAAGSSSGSPAAQSSGSATDAGSAGDNSSASTQQLPDVVVLKMLKREVLLTSAKLHALTSDLLDGQRTISRLRSQIRHVSHMQSNSQLAWVCYISVCCDASVGRQQPVLLTWSEGASLCQKANKSACAYAGVDCWLQGEPELERLKRELEELKHAPRGLEGTFRTAAEMERHRWVSAYSYVLIMITHIQRQYNI
jgi:hypothetical protein